MTFMKEQARFSTIEATPISITTLYYILSLRRAARSEGDEALIDNLIMPLDPDVDAYGNLFVTVGRAPAVAFTAHTDTVHREHADEAVLTQPLTTEGGNMLELHSPQQGDVLGADDGTGVWVLLNMIEAGVEGLYCFYRDEEIGRLGSEWSAENEPDRYEGIDLMLSFDRKGTEDIITHQMGDRCCSELFAEHIAEAIHPDCMPDDTGSFTDSYTFMHLIPECTNICVGYYMQHTSWESQDLTWATYLVNRLIAINWSIVPAERTPKAPSPFGFDDMYDMDSLTMDELLTFYPEEASFALQSYMGITKGDLITAMEDIELDYAAMFQDLEYNQ